MEVNHAGPSTILLLVLIPLLAWRMYARFKRMVGRQRLSAVRPWITIALFPMLVLLLGAATMTHPERLALLAGGLIAGTLLGIFGLSKTEFERTGAGLFYTPNAHLGLALSLLFAVRIAFRLVQPQDSGEFASSPLTLGVFGLLAGYYTAYAIGLVRWRAQASVSATRSS